MLICRVAEPARGGPWSWPFQQNGSLPPPGRRMRSGRCRAAPERPRRRDLRRPTSRSSRCRPCRLRRPFSRRCRRRRNVAMAHRRNADARRLRLADRNLHGEPPGDMPEPAAAVDSAESASPAPRAVRRHVHALLTWSSCDRGSSACRGSRCRADRPSQVLGGARGAASGTVQAKRMASSCVRCVAYEAGICLSSSGFRSDETLAPAILSASIARFAVRRRVRR